MKRGRLFFSLTLLVALNAAPTFADDVAQQLASVVVDRFDDANQRVWNEGQIDSTEDRQWVVVGSKFAAKEGDVQYPRLAYVDSWPDALFGTNPNKLALKSLGVYAKFDRKGFNFYEVYPTKKDATGAVVPYGMPLPGIAKTIDIWVWGQNYNTTFEIHVRDYRGIPYVLKGGSLLFTGWKNVQIPIPSSIPQTQPYLPHYQPLKLTKIVVRTDPEERVDGFYVYFDQFKVLTDMHQNPYDGRTLMDSDFISKYWSSNQTQGK